MAFEFLRVLITTTISQLNAMGVGRNERVCLRRLNFDPPGMRRKT